jgi:hypothetical protein
VEGTVRSISEECVESRPPELGTGDRLVRVAQIRRNDMSILIGVFVIFSMLVGNTLFALLIAAVTILLAA